MKQRIVHKCHLVGVYFGTIVMMHGTMNVKNLFSAHPHFPDVDIARNRFFSVVFMFSYLMYVHIL